VSGTAPGIGKAVGDFTLIIDNPARQEIGSIVNGGQRFQQSNVSDD
jgi:hypothetical protein